MAKKHNSILEDKNTKVFKTGKGKKFEIEFDPDRPNRVKVILNGENVMVGHKELYDFIFATSDLDKLAELIPVRKLEMTRYFRQHNVEATKDIKKGEKIIVNCEIDVPTIVKNAILKEEENNGR